MTTPRTGGPNLCPQCSKEAAHITNTNQQLARVEALLDNPRKLCPCVSEADLRNALQGGNQ